MRKLSKILVVAVGLLAIGALSSAVSANNLLVGTFTMPHSTQWNGTTLPPGEYRFRLTRTQTDANMLVISGEKQTLSVLVFAQAACESCKTEAIKVNVQGDNRIVTSLELPGYHVDFKAPRTEGDNKEDAAKSTGWVEQVAVHVNSN